MKNLKGKVAFITGGSRGMGAGITKRLSAEGAKVIFTHSGKNQQRADEVLEFIRSQEVALIADNENPEALIDALKQSIDSFGAIDILINNAGIGIMKPLESHTLEDFDRLVKFM